MRRLASVQQSGLLAAAATPSEYDRIRVGLKSLMRRNPICHSVISVPASFSVPSFTFPFIELSESSLMRCCPDEIDPSGRHKKMHDSDSWHSD